MRREQQYVLDEYSDEYEWKMVDIPTCACGKRDGNDACREVRVTTFSEVYECGFRTNYTNHNGYNDNLISVDGKRVK